MARVTEYDLTKALRRLLAQMSGIQPFMVEGIYGMVVPMGKDNTLVAYHINVTDRGDKDGKKYVVETHAGQQPFGGRLRTANEMLECLDFACVVVEHPGRDTFFRLSEPIAPRG
jgi:hypothetical protein